MRRGWVAAVFVLALSVRVFNLNVPFVEPFNSISRLAICGSVARNFYQHGFNFFYPEVDENGDGPSLLSAEMPTYTYLMALAYKLSGGVHEWAARSVSVMFSMGSLLILYLLLSRLANQRIAFFALILMAVSPMNVALARSIQCDATMVFAGLMALYLFHRYCEDGRWVWFIGSAFAMALAVGTKIHSVCLMMPILYLGWRKDGWSVFLKPKNYSYCFIVSLSLIWYVYMWKASKNQALAYDPFHYALGGYLESFAPAIMKLPLKALILHMLTPIGAIFFIIGISKSTFKAYSFIWVWFLSVIIYLLVMWPTAVIHPYYMLALMPPISFFVALGVEKVWAGNGPSGKILRHPITLLVILCIEAATVLYYYRLLYFIPPDRQLIVTAGRVVEKSTPKDALIAASWGASPIQLYYCNRKGWVFDLKSKPDGERLIGDLESLRKKGVDFFVTTTVKDLRETPLFERYIRTHFNVMRDDEGIFLADVRSFRP